MPTTSTTPADQNKRRQRVQAAETGMLILKVLARLGGSASLTAIAQTSDTNAAKVHRYLASLAAEGLVAQHPATQHYQLGSEAVLIGLAALRQCDPVRLGEPVLLTLCEALQVTCFIAVSGNLGPTVMRIEEPPVPVSVNIRLGSVLPQLWSASGRAFLAFSNDAQLHARAHAEYAVASAAQHASLDGADSIAAFCQQLRTQGCASVRDSLMAGISAVAAPIRDAHGNVIAVLTALGASNGFDTQPSAPIRPAVIQAAQQISASMGYLPAP